MLRKQGIREMEAGEPGETGQSHIVAVEVGIQGVVHVRDVVLDAANTKHSEAACHEPEEDAAPRKGRGFQILQALSAASTGAGGEAGFRHSRSESLYLICSLMPASAAAL